MAHRRHRFNPTAVLLSLLLLAVGCTADDAGGESDQSTGDRGRQTTPEGGGDGTDETGGSEPSDTESPEPPAGLASLSGTVWAPGNAPGMVPAGQEIPVFEALVSLSRVRPEPIAQHAYCEACAELPESGVLTDHQGAFVLEHIVPDTYWLVIQKGQFRLEQQLEIAADQVRELPATETVFPSHTDPGRGWWIPRIAIAIGNYDHLEDILGKMGLGEVDSYGELVPDSGMGQIDVWDNGAPGDYREVWLGTLTDLVGDLEQMLSYHIIFVPCAADFNTAALQNDAVLRNIRDYVAAGGKLYVTDWSGEWMDNVFPAPIELEGDGIDTPPSAFDSDTTRWHPEQFGSANGQPYDSFNGRAVDADLQAWLSGQEGPTPFDSAQVAYDAESFAIQGAWNIIDGVHAIQVGLDPDGEPVIDEPRVFVMAGTEHEPEPLQPMTVTFEPVGCGRVLYSTYHTTDEAHVGLTPQERVLLFLIMEIGVCQAGKEFAD